MQKTSIRKYSILGLVLLAASAVTAAMLPSSSNDKANVLGGSLTNDNGATSRVTCTASDGPTNAISNCNPSTGAASSTTGVELNESASISGGANTTGTGADS
jgi:hypothetical protein